VDAELEEGRLRILRRLVSLAVGWDINVGSFQVSHS